MEVEFTLTRDDLVAYAEHLIRSHRLRNRKKSLLRILFSGAVVVMAMVIGVASALTIPPAPKGKGGDPIALLAIVASIAVVICLVGILWSSPRRPPRWMVRRNVDQLLRKPMADRLLQPQRIAISPAYLTHSTRESTSQSAWSAIYQVAIADDHVYLFSDPDNALLVPKRAFRWEHEFHEFAATARRYHQEATAHSDTGGT